MEIGAACLALAACCFSLGGWVPGHLVLMVVMVVLQRLSCSQVLTCRHDPVLVFLVVRLRALQLLLQVYRPLMHFLLGHCRLGSVRLLGVAPCF